jgi:hypothetical protein
MIHKKTLQNATMYQHFIIPYLYKAQQWLVDVVRHSTVPDNVHQPHVQQPSKYGKSEAASAVLGS